MAGVMEFCGSCGGVLWQLWWNAVAVVMGCCNSCDRVLWQVLACCSSRAHSACALNIGKYDICGLCVIS